MKTYLKKLNYILIVWTDVAGDISMFPFALS